MNSSHVAMQHSYVATQHWGWYAALQHNLFGLEKAMNGFEKYGEAMLLANEGNAQAAQAIAAAFKRLMNSFRGYVGAMPATLPPTESFQSK